MRKIKGQNLRIFVNGFCVAEAVQCQIQIQGNTEDSSTKDTTGDFSQTSVVAKSWSVSVSTIDASPNYIKSLLSVILDKQPVTLKWDQTTGAMNRNAMNKSFARTGAALLTDFTLETPNRQNATINIQFTGTGPITNL